MNWFILLSAGLLEIVWAVGLKHTQGFTRPWPSLLTIAAMIASLVLLGIAMKQLPLGTAYALWVGIGVVGTALVGVWVFGESASPAKWLSIALVLAGIVGLKVSEN